MVFEDFLVVTLKLNYAIVVDGSGEGTGECEGEKLAAELIKAMFFFSQSRFFAAVRFVWITAESSERSRCRK